MTLSPPGSPGGFDVSLTRKALDQAGISNEKRIELLTQLQTFLTTEDATLDLPPTDLSPWISTFTLISGYLQAAEVSAHNSKEIPEPEEDRITEPLAADFDEADDEPETPEPEPDENELITVSIRRKYLPLWEKLKAETDGATEEVAADLPPELAPMDTDFVIDEIVDVEP
jgi:hypothetical protein